MSKPTPPRSPDTITLHGFCDEMVERLRNRPEHRTCFVLGAGASIESGIPLGATLAKRWLQEIFNRENFGDQTFESWVMSSFTGLSPDAAGERYGEIYERRFGREPVDGLRDLESIMEGKDPSIGYSYLALLLSKTQHNVAITTNFDNLIADAVSIYGDKFPVVLADDAIASYATAEIPRPLIAKIHGGLGFKLRNSTEETNSLADDWRTALATILNRYDPVVVGYAGNDGSLMDFLADADLRKDLTINWCLRCPPAELRDEISNAPQRVRDLAKKRRVRFIPIEGFDAFFLQLYNRFAKADPIRFPEPLNSLKEKHRRREETHEQARTRLSTPEMGRTNLDARGSTSSTRALDTVEDGGQKVVTGESSLRALLAEEGARRDEKPWWTFQAEIDTAETDDAKDAAYERAIQALPRSAPLLGNYANFLRTVCNDHDRAEAFYKRAIDADPKDADYLGNYAVFLQNVRKDYDQAEAFYKRAIDADPRRASILGNFANFLMIVRKDYDQAEAFYKRAIDADPKHANVFGNYALFLTTVRKDHDQAEAFYKRAIDADPKRANILANYAYFLTNIRKDHDQAEVFYKRAIDADPKDANIFGNYANFLTDVRKNHDQAEAFYKRAIDADPKQANSLGNYAKLCFETERPSLALHLIERAEALSPLPAVVEVELKFYRYALDSESREESLARLAVLISVGTRSPNWPLAKIIELAKAAGHPNLALLKTIDRVVTQGEDAKTLEAFPEWAEAQGKQKTR